MYEHETVPASPSRVSMYDAAKVLPDAVSVAVSVPQDTVAVQDEVLTVGIHPPSIGVY